MKFPQKLIRSFFLPAIILRVIKQIHRQKRFLKQNIEDALDAALSKSDGTLDQKDLDKINRYYGLAVPALLGEAFCALRGSKMSLNERWASTAQGAMTGLFDDFFDKDYLSDEAIGKLINTESSSLRKHSNQELFEFFYKIALENVPDYKKMKEGLIEVYKAQVESKKQEKSLISIEELKQITFYKGGNSLLFYRTAFIPEANSAELKLLYNLGGLMQLANDIFDVYKDREAGICTLITETKSIGLIRILFKSFLCEYYKSAFDIGFPQKNIRRFLDILSIGIFSRCFVCLDQLEQNERFTEDVFNVHDYNRTQLICDMDKPLNMLRSARSLIIDIP